jgi:hypothetical protein
MRQEWDIATHDKCHHGRVSWSVVVAFGGDPLAAEAFHETSSAVVVDAAERYAGPPCGPPSF